VRCGRAAPPARDCDRFPFPISCSYYARTAGPARSTWCTEGTVANEKTPFVTVHVGNNIPRKQNSATRRLGRRGAPAHRVYTRGHTPLGSTRSAPTMIHTDSHSLNHYMIVQLASACVQATHRNRACQSTLTVPHRSPYHQIPRQPKAPREREKHANQPLSARGQR
jgi:hypothetical protein